MNRAEEMDLDHPAEDLFREACKEADVFIDDLWIDVLQSEAAEKKLRELQQSGDGKKVKEFWDSEGWRILILEEPCIDTVPLWVLLSAYELRFRDVGIVYRMLRNLDFYHEDVLIDKETIEVIISVIERYASIGLYGETEDKLIAGMEAPKKFAVLYRYETHKDKARAFMDKCGLVQKKAVDGFPMPMLVQNYHETRMDSSASEGQPETLPLTREKVLAEVGKWYALEPSNEAIRVGLMRLQDSPYREIYSKVFGEDTGEFTKAMREKIRRRWCLFLNLAEDKGIPRKTLEDMVSPR